MCLLICIHAIVSVFRFEKRKVANVGGIIFWCGQKIILQELVLPPTVPRGICSFNFPLTSLLCVLIIALVFVSAY